MQRFLKIGFGTFGTLILLLLGLSALGYYIFQWSEFQTSLTQKAAQWLTKEMGADVSVGNVNIKWFDEITIEDVNIKDLKNRDMIYVREVYVNFKSNLDFGCDQWPTFTNNFDPECDQFVKFDNNLDFVMLKEPDIKMVRENDGSLNIDNWLQKIQNLAKPKSNKKSKPTQFTIDEAIIQNGTFEMTDPRKKTFFRPNYSTILISNLKKLTEILSILRSLEIPYRFKGKIFRQKIIEANWR